MQIITSWLYLRTQKQIKFALDEFFFDFNSSPWKFWNFELAKYLCGWNYLVFISDQFSFYLLYLYWLGHQVRHVGRGK